MKFAICNELFLQPELERGWEFSFQQASRFGYRGIELAPFTLVDCLGENSGDKPSPLTLSGAKRREIRELAGRLDLEIVGLHWLLAHTTGLHLTSADPLIRNLTAQYLIGLAELCGDLGGRVMVLGSPQQRNLDAATSVETGTERAIEVLEKVLPKLESLDIVLALEPLGPEEVNFLNTAQQTCELAAKLANPHIGLTLDVKAMSTEAIAYDGLIRSHQNILTHFHANDPNRQGPGMGSVDFVPIAQALQAIDYSGWVSVEVFDYSPGRDKLASHSLKYLQQTFV